MYEGVLPRTRPVVDDRSYGDESAPEGSAEGMGKEHPEVFVSLDALVAEDRNLDLEVRLSWPERGHAVSILSGPPAQSDPLTSTARNVPLRMRFG